MLDKIDDDVIRTILRALLGAHDPTLSTEQKLRFPGDLSVDVSTGRFNNYLTDEEGDLVQLVRKTRGCTDEEAEEWLDKFEPVEEPQPTDAAYVAKLTGQTETPIATSTEVEPKRDIADFVPEFLEHERALIGILLSKPEVLDGVEEELVATDFIHELHSRLFICVQDARQNDYPITIANMIGALGGDAGVETMHGFTLSQYVAHLIASAPAVPDGVELRAFARDLAREVRIEYERETGTGDFAEVDEPPKPYQPKFGAVHWSTMHSVKVDPYDYVIEDLIPVGEPVLIFGESQSGKSYKTMDMAMAVARGVSYFGRAVTQGLVIYCAVEAGNGFFQLRMPGYEVHHGLKQGERIPFVCFPKKFDLFGSETDINDLIADIDFVRKMYPEVPLAAVVIDTYNRATPGIDEISGKDVGKIIARLDRIRSTFKTGLWLVHHKNASGMPRGHTSLYAAFETAIEISRGLDTKDFNGREIRTAKLAKARETEDGSTWQFVLRRVGLGTMNRYGKENTAAVVELPQTSEAPARANSKPGAGGFVIRSQKTRMIFRCLVDALREHGGAPPPDAGVPSAVGLVVHRDFWRDALLKRTEVGETDPAKRADGVKKAIQRAMTAFPEWGIAGVAYPWVWRTGRAVEGFHMTAAEQGTASTGSSTEDPAPGSDQLDFSTLDPPSRDK